MTTGKPSARALLVAATLALTLAACGGQSTGAGPTASPSPSAPPTATPAPGAAPAGLAQGVGSMGTPPGAASDGHPLYTFNSDTPGGSNCQGGCTSTRPPPSRPAGTT